MAYDIQERDKGNRKLYYSVAMEMHRATSFLEQELDTIWKFNLTKLR